MAMNGSRESSPEASTVTQGEQGERLAPLQDMWVNASWTGEVGEEKSSVIPGERLWSFHNW